MDGVWIAAAVASAFLHAAWNAAVKASPDAQGAMAAQIVAAGMLALPFLFVVPLPPPAALPWLAASVGLSLLYVAALLAGYANGGGFGLVYPLARAVSPLLVTLFANLVIGEVPSRVGLAGIALVSCGVALFASGDLRNSPLALAFALCAGGLAAALAIADANGARVTGSALSFGLLASVGNAIVFGTFHRIRSGVPLLGSLRRHAGRAAICAVASNVSYLLILWVWSHGPVAIGSALRDTAVAFAALIAAFWLKEPLGGRRAAAIALVLVGAVTLRFA